MLLILGGIGAGVYAFYTKPQFHAQVVDYSKQGLEWGKQKWAELNNKAPRAPHDSSTAGPVINVEPAPAVPATQPVLPRTSEDSQATNKPEISNPVGVPAKSPEPPATSKSDPWEQIYGKQPAPKSEPPKADSSSTSNPKPTGTIDDVRKLYREAIDAEGNGDYATAVKKYEQIKDFSRDLWPRDLDLRLTQAKRQVQ